MVLISNLELRISKKLDIIWNLNVEISDEFLQMIAYIQLEDLNS